MVTFFHIFIHGDVVNAQTWEVSPQKNPVLELKCMAVEEEQLYLRGGVQTIN